LHYASSNGHLSIVALLIEKGSNKEAKPSGKSARTMKQVPGKPAADLEDVRRSTRVI